jgi:hypothetical protein
VGVPRPGTEELDGLDKGPSRESSFSPITAVTLMLLRGIASHYRHMADLPEDGETHRGMEKHHGNRKTRHLERCGPVRRPVVGRRPEGATSWKPSVNVTHEIPQLPGKGHGLSPEKRGYPARPADRTASRVPLRRHCAPHPPSRAAPGYCRYRPDGDPRAHALLVRMSRVPVRQCPPDPARLHLQRSVTRAPAGSHSARSGEPPWIPGQGAANAPSRRCSGANLRKPREFALGGPTGQDFR